MSISRELNVRLNWILNEAVPPFIRDRRWFGWIITRILYKDKAPIYMAFNDRVYEMSEAEFAAAYRDIQSTAMTRPLGAERSRIARVWPPRPRVPSQYRPPARGARRSSTSSNRTGM